MAAFHLIIYGRFWVITEARLGIFMASEPDSLRIDFDAKAANPTVHILKADPIPPELLAIAGDAIHNLRSASWITSPTLLFMLMGKSPPKRLSSQSSRSDYDREARNQICSKSRGHEEGSHRFYQRHQAIPGRE